jgi:hypothetical protein
MKEIFISPEIIEKEKRRLELERPDNTETEIYQILVIAYGGVNVANYLNWSIKDFTREDK